MFSYFFTIITDETAATLFKFNFTKRQHGGVFGKDIDNLRVIIVSRKRSGSSFVGELFNQNTDIFYVFEPLVVLTTQALKRYMKEDVFDEHSTQILNAILSCNFLDLPSGWWKHSKRTVCEFMSSVKQTEMCEPSKGNSLNVILSNLTTICKNNSRFMGVKTIRLTKLSVLKPLMKAFNIKIIHLVRDPRGTMNSRFNVNEKNLDFLRKRGKTGDEISDLCQSIHRNLKYISNSSNIQWLKNRYKLIRFEDIASNPSDTAIQIYRFLGLPFPDNLKTVDCKRIQILVPVEHFREHGTLKQSLIPGVNVLLGEMLTKFKTNVKMLCQN